MGLVHTSFSRLFIIDVTVTKMIEGLMSVVS
jgi:hypothetical protein